MQQKHFQTVHSKAKRQFVFCYSKGRNCEAPRSLAVRDYGWAGPETPGLESHIFPVRKSRVQVSGSFGLLISPVKTCSRVLSRPQGPSQKESQKLYLFPWKFWFQNLAAFNEKSSQPAVVSIISSNCLFSCSLPKQNTMWQPPIHCLLCQPNRRKQSSVS